MFVSFFFREQFAVCAYEGSICLIRVGYCRSISEIKCSLARMKCVDTRAREKVPRGAVASAQFSFMYRGDRAVCYRFGWRPTRRLAPVFERGRRLTYDAIDARGFRLSSR